MSVFEMRCKSQDVNRRRKAFDVRPELDLDGIY